MTEFSVARNGFQSAEVSQWIQALSRFRTPSLRRGIAEIALTVVPFVALWMLSWLALGIGYWLSLLIAIPAGAFLVRLFLILHDCGHGSFFRQRMANDWVGRVCGVLTLTPFGVWRIAHNMHHATSGDLDRRGLGDIETMTVSEYKASPWWNKLRYRLYRHPIVMFGLGPAYVFLISNRLPMGLMTQGWRPWFSAMANNLVLVICAALMMWAIGIVPFLMIHLPIILIAASIGIWLFFVQHQFEQTVWTRGQDWSMQHAALRGSSHYDLPHVLRWLTANIGVHHVHHLNARIPFYRLRRVLKEIPELKDIGRLTLWQSFRCVRLTLWDEGRQRMISFRELRFS